MFASMPGMRCGWLLCFLLLVVRPVHAGGERQVFAATLYPLAAWLAQVVDDDVEVVVVLPAGANPHTFEPLPAQVRLLQRASLLVRVGSGLDDWVEKLTGLGPTPPALMTFSDHVPLLPLREKGGRDPHFWLDPLLVRDHAVPALVGALERIAPVDAASYRLRAERWREELSHLDARLRTKLAPVQGRAYVAVHSAWRYFANRYGLVEAATIEPVPGRELSAKEMTKLVREIRRSQARAVVVEPYVFSKTARQIAHETGIPLVTIDPFGSGELRGGYVRLLEEIARAFLEALR